MENENSLRQPDLQDMQGSAHSDSGNNFADPAISQKDNINPEDEIVRLSKENKRLIEENRRLLEQALQDKKLNNYLRIRVHRLRRELNQSQSQLE